MRYFKKIAADIPGLPDRSQFTPYPEVTGEITVPAVLHEHEALKAGLQYDLRIYNDGTGVAHSWAIRKGLPGPGKVHLAIQQPEHTLDYMDFEGNIPEGYGAGDVKKAFRGDVKVIEATPKKIKFELDGTHYILIHTGDYLVGDKNWIIRQYNA